MEREEKDESQRSYATMPASVLREFGFAQGCEAGSRANFYTKESELRDSRRRSLKFLRYLEWIVSRHLNSRFHKRYFEVCVRLLDAKKTKYLLTRRVV